jgi:hypothetical protein
MRNDDDLRRMFDRLSFHDEPPMRTGTSDDLRKGRRRLRRRRVAGVVTAAAGSAAVATAVVLMSPGGGPDIGPGLDAAAGADDGSGPKVVTVEGGAPSFAVTYDTMADLAAAHFDPDSEHLETSVPVEIDPSGPTNWEVSSRLAWTNPGESGVGLVRVIVTLPGYAEQEGAYGDVATQIGCDFEGHDVVGCAERVADSGEPILVAEPNPDRDLLFGVVHEREDGSLAAVAVHDLFGNNSLEPVSSVDITLEQAVDFVTDPKARVDDAEAATELARAPGDDLVAREPNEEPDFSAGDIVAAPEVEEMTAEERDALLDECVLGVDDWSEFTPVFGLWVKHDSSSYLGNAERVGWVIAETGEAKMVCDSQGASLFDGPDSKTGLSRDVPIDTLEVGGFGTYGHDVSKVTVQRDGQLEQEAVMRDGYWYLPVPEEDLRVAVRAYADDDQLVFDSTADSTSDSGAQETARD